MLGNGVFTIASFDGTSFLSGTVNIAAEGRLSVGTNSVTVTSGVTLVKDGSWGEIGDEVGTLTVLSGGVVTHSLRRLPGLVLNVTGTLDVQSGGQINVSGKGLRGGNNGSAFGIYGETFDANDVIVQGSGGGSAGTGAGYGGLGAAVSGGSSNPVYGVIEDPRHLGSGGSANNQGQAAGGHGGGRITITVADLVNNGVVAADGGAGAVVGGARGGGGSGGGTGSTANTVGGSGQIRTLRR